MKARNEGGRPNDHLRFPTSLSCDLASSAMVSLDSTESFHFRVAENPPEDGMYRTRGW